MEEKTKKQMRMIYLVLAVVLISTSFISSFEIRQIYTTDLGGGLRPLAVAIQDKDGNNKRVFENGEDIFYSNGQDVFASCKSLTADFKLKKGFKTLRSISNSFGTVGYQTAYFQVAISPNDYQNNDGEYTIESLFYCDGFKLDPLTGEINQDATWLKSNFEVIDSQEEPPVNQCNRTCNAGEILINEDSSDCYCQIKWTPNDGICEIGDTSMDCDEQRTCRDGQVKLDGLCTERENICIKDGGTRNCTNDTDLSALSLMSFALGGILIVVGGFRRYGK